MRVSALPKHGAKRRALDNANYARGSGTRYRITYGIASNYLNGLNVLDGYWPDTLEIDGLNIVNWSETMGNELHVLVPLNMTGKPAEQSRSGAWTVKNLAYDGKPFTPATFGGDDELAETGEIAVGVEGVRETKQILHGLTPEQIALLDENLEKSDIVVAYKGDEPRVLLRASGNFSNSNDSYTSVYPYFVEHRGDMDVGYYSGREFMKQWREIKAKNPDAGSFYRLNIYSVRTEGSQGEVQDGVTEVLHVRLAKTHETCRHEWGEPTYEWSADNASVTARVTCVRDATHTLEKRVVVQRSVEKEPTASEAGVAVYVARFDGAPFEDQIRRVVLPATGGAGGEDPSGGDGGGEDVPAKPSGATALVRPVLRMASAKTGQRRYVMASQAIRNLARSGWRYEGVAFYAPARGGVPVYQLKRSGRFIYIAKLAELRKLQKSGWTSRKVVFRALKSGGVKVYRLRNKSTGAYLLTKNVREVRSLKRQGWKSNGFAFRASG